DIVVQDLKKEVLWIRFILQPMRVCDKLPLLGVAMNMEASSRRLKSEVTFLGVVNHRHRHPLEGALQIPQRRAGRATG
ncbi:MAG: hypothetical protein ACE5IA_02540, partial [Dehalococcoidia bacterium]